MNLYIGTIIFGESTAKYLPFFFDSLKNQIGIEYKLLLWDNCPKPDNASARLATDYFGAEVLRGSKENIGFARAYNEMIAEARKAGADFFLALNPDMELSDGAIWKMLSAMEDDAGLGSLTPKVMRWDFARKALTNVIDTCGLVERSALRFEDLGQGTEDCGQFDQVGIIGPSGAAALYRLSALESVKDKYGYFDERMFMYKEDCDLAYRLSVAGFKSVLIPQALVYHDRTATAQGQSLMQVVANRRSKSRQVRAWSFVNQHLLMIKHWRRQNWSRKMSIAFFFLQNFFYALLLEGYLLHEYRTIWKMK